MQHDVVIQNLERKAEKTANIIHCASKEFLLDCLNFYNIKFGDKYLENLGLCSYNKIFVNLWNYFHIRLVCLRCSSNKDENTFDLVLISLSEIFGDSSKSWDYISSLKVWDYTSMYLTTPFLKKKAFNRINMSVPV